MGNKKMNQEKILKRILPTKNTNNPPKKQGPIILTGDFNAKIKISKKDINQSTTRNRGNVGRIDGIYIPNPYIHKIRSRHLDQSKQD